MALIMKKTMSLIKVFKYVTDWLMSKIILKINKLTKEGAANKRKHRNVVWEEWAASHHPVCLTPKWPHKNGIN